MLSGGASPERTIRKSRSGPRRAIVLGLVHVAIAIHITQWWLGGRTVSPVEPSESMQTLETGAVNAGFIFFAVAILSTLIFGRFFCGWGCHIVALQDLCGWMLKKVNVRPRPFRSRLLVYVPLVFALYMFVWPTFRREVAAPLAAKWWPEAATWLGPVGAFPGFHNDLLVEDFWATFPPIAVAIPFFLVCGFACVYFLGAKGFCTYGCPYGGFFAPADMVSPGRIIVDHDKCEGCGHCTAVCTSNVRVHEEIRDFGMVVDPGCMKCLDCVSVCPNDALRFGFGAPPVMKSRKRGRADTRAARPRRPKRTFDLSWTEELVIAAVFAGAFFAWRGLYDVIPMLMAIGVAGCVAYIAWKTWRMLRDSNLRLHNFQLKLRGKLRPAGAVFLLVALATIAATAQGGYVQWAERKASHYDGLVTAPADVVLSGRAALVPASDKAAAEDAIRWYRRASSFRMGGYGMATTSETLFRMAWLLAVTGDYAEAEAIMRRALRQGESTEQGVVHLSNLIAAQGRMEEAERVVREWIAANGAGELSVSEVAKLIARQRGVGPAEEFLRESVLAYPELHGLSAGVIRAMLGAGRVAQAESLARALVERRPEDGALLAQLGALLMQVYPPGDARFGEGVALVERAVELDPKNATAHQQRAIARAISGDMAGAEASLREAMRLAPEDPSLRFMLAELLRQTGRAAEADALLQEPADGHLPGPEAPERTPTGGTRTD